jgi:hypothetical protein
MRSRAQALAMSGIEIPEHKARDVGSDIYGAARLQLATLVKVALDEAGVVWFLDGGTLLGAYRNGEQIAHDDDFDMAIHVSDFGGEKDLVALAKRMAPYLPAPYEIRTVTSYASKLEVFDCTSRTYLLATGHYHGADFHTVTVDVQVMTDAADGRVVYLHDMLQQVRVPRDAIDPTGKIVCGGVGFNAPHDPLRFLEAVYGYIGTDARYDERTRMYVRIEEPEA